MSDKKPAASINRKTASGVVAKEAPAWCIIDSQGNLVPWTCAPSRIATITCRLRQMGAVFKRECSDEEIERSWRENKPEAEDVTRVMVCALLN